ncbi:MAG: mechanosensitive ion channel family protein [Alphaproteobacteria bacterium]|nr:mechanosensitive ion channel family protein [Alphaproteobacteria bacterium]MCW5744014.1 mechanosensitive ion channel family protein [Alphaproteobacteria bacterium]
MDLFGIEIPAWIVSTVILTLPALLVLAVYRWLIRQMIRLAGKLSETLQIMLMRARAPATGIVLLTALSLALPLAGFERGVADTIGQLLLVAYVLTLGWAMLSALDFFTDRYLVQLNADTIGAGADLAVRKQVTQVRVLRRVAKTMLIIIVVAAALMTIESVRQYGVSLLASAGAAGLVLALAARPVLSNLLAGIQIAITQPIRVEDAVIVENEWGWIETINSTYVVVRLWDLRRMVLPLTYFIEKPFQNWTYGSSQLLGTVFLHVDYTVPVARVRAKLEEIARGSKLWDGQVVVLQVTDVPTNMVQLRALVSARDAGQAFDLRCEVREKLIEFLQAEYPHALPRQRAEIAAAPGPGPSDGRPREGRASLTSITPADEKRAQRA